MIEIKYYTCKVCDETNIHVDELDTHYLTCKGVLESGDKHE
jgi:hypothetical protein